MNARTIREELFVADHPVLQQRVAFVLPVVPEDAPAAIREGIARRRVTATTGRCPCGARVDYGDRVAGQVVSVEVQHTASCPASDAKLIKAVRRWVR